MRFAGFALVTSLCLPLLATCGGHTGEPSVILPRTTKVVGSDMRAALSSFDPDGTLRFSKSTGALAGLAAGDVLVSEPTVAAPHGFLRRVMAVDRSGGQVVVSTAQATLSEAIDQGELNAVAELRPEMLARTVSIPPPRTKRSAGLQEVEGAVPLMPGVQVLAAEDGDYPFFVKIDASLGDNIAAQGFIGFGLSFDFQVRLGAKWLPPFVKIEHVRAGLTIRQKGSLSLVAAGGVKIETQIPVATFPFTPIVFAIGPVPVVITPFLKIHVGARGELTASLTYSVAEELPVSAGLDYNPKDGWRAYSSGTPKYDSNSVAAKVGAAVEVYAGARGELLLYGLAGGFTEINGFVKLDAVVPRSPIWRLTGGVDAFVGVSLDLIVAKYQAKENLVRLLVPIADAPNGAPTIQIAMPGAGTSVDTSTLGGTRLLAEVSDLEDGTACCAVSWTDDRGETIPPGRDVMASFSTLGTHTLRATATDQHGATASAVVSITVTKKPPTVTIVQPAPMQGGVAAGVPIAVEGRGMDGLGLIPCDQLSWKSDGAGDTFSEGGRGCLLTVTFATEGPRRLTLTGTDGAGMVGTASVDVAVGPPPATPVITPFIDFPPSNAELRLDVQYTLGGHAVDTGQRVFRDFVWRAAGCGIDRVIGTTAGGTTGAPPTPITQTTLPWRPSDSGFTTCARVELRLTVTTEDGAGVGLTMEPTIVSIYRLQ